MSQDVICFGEADVGWMCGSTKETQTLEKRQKHLNGKLENPEMEVEWTLKSTGWLGWLCSMEVARWCFGNGWQDLLRALLPCFPLIKNTFSDKSIFIWFAQFRVLCLFKPSRVFYLRLSFWFRLDSVTSPFARPYESHEVTLSIDPAKLGVVAMAPFDGKAECIWMQHANGSGDQDRVGKKKINRCSRNIS